MLTEATKGTAIVRLADDGVLETVWEGRVTASTIVDLLANTRAVLSGSKQIRYWYSDTSAVANYAVDLHKPATELLTFLKSRGLVEIVGVVPSGMIRMLSTSLAFVVSLKIKMFATSSEARAYLNSVKRLPQT